MSSNTNTNTNTSTSTARSPARTSSSSKKPTRRPSTSTTPGTLGGRRTQRKSDQKRALEMFGEEPGDLFDGLVARIGGGIMDCTDALEVSAHESGVSEQDASAAVTSVLDSLRADLAPRLMAFRTFALRNVFKLPPANDEERLDKQLKACAKRLAEARNSTREIDLAQRDLQKRITLLEDGATALQPAQLAVCEKENKHISKIAHELKREVNGILPISERQVISEITASPLDDDTIQLPSKKAALSTISAVFQPHSDEDMSIGADDVHMDDKAGGGNEDSVMNALRMLEGCLPRQEK